MLKAPIYNAFSVAFGYPSTDYAYRISELQHMLNTDYPEAANALQPFTDWVTKTEYWQIEEVFTKTFHIQAICYLDLGYVIFGEDYKRGEFLVNMKREQFQAGNDCGDELADNLSNVLSLIPKLKDEAFREELISLIMLPAFEKMLVEFESSRIELKNKILRKKHNAVLQEDLQFGNVYRNALISLSKVVMSDFDTDKYKKPEIQPLIGGAFLSGCGTSCGTPSDSFNKPSQLKKTA